MALIHCDFFSEVLGLSSSMYVILPQSTTKQIGMASKVIKKKHPVLYLLHGMSDDHSVWLRRTSIERYVSDLGIAVVMPAVHRSYYSNMKSGGRYWDYISEEVPRIAREFFSLSSEREDNYAAGLSMGGYGAFKLALRCPDKYSAAASLSGALDPLQFMKEEESTLRGHELKSIFGDASEFNEEENDLFFISEQLVQKGIALPKLYQCCGIEDFLLKHNRGFKEHCCRFGIELTYEESPGSHMWGYWDTQIQRVLKWLPINNGNK